MNPPNAQACLPQELIACPVFLLGKLGFKLKKQAMDELEAAGSSMYDYSVLALLAESACEAQTTIADMLSLDRSQLVGLLDGLEERKMIERRRDPNDRRRHTVTVTAEGKRQLEKLRAIMNRIAEDFLSPLDDESRAQLHELLLQLASHHDSRFALPAEPVAVP